MDLFSVKEVLMNKNLASFTQVKNKIKDSVDLDDDVGSAITAAYLIIC